MPQYIRAGANQVRGFAILPLGCEFASTFYYGVWPYLSDQNILLQYDTYMYICHRVDGHTPHFPHALSSPPNISCRTETREQVCYVKDQGCVSLLSLFFSSVISSSIRAATRAQGAGKHVHGDEHLHGSFANRSGQLSAERARKAPGAFTESL